MIDQETCHQVATAIRAAFGGQNSAGFFRYAVDDGRLVLTDTVTLPAQAGREDLWADPVS